MIELTLVTLALLFVVFVVKPGRTPPLANPMIIHRIGQYHITLAPQLNLAQPLIEDIAKGLGSPAELAPNSRSLSFEVRDPDVTAHGKVFYLLAITQRNGMLYFQATTSDSEDPQERIATLQEFANQTLLKLPAQGELDEKFPRGHKGAPTPPSLPTQGELDEQLSELIISVTQKVAQRHRASILVI